MKATFEIEWQDHCGRGWMNVWNLLSCLNTDVCCGAGLILQVTEVLPTGQRINGVEDESIEEL